MARVRPQRQGGGRNIALSGRQIKKLLIIQFLPLRHMKYITDIMPKGTNGAGQVSAAGSQQKGSLQAGNF
jgi:hypothetical protein